MTPTVLMTPNGIGDGHQHISCSTLLAGMCLPLVSNSLLKLTSQDDNTAVTRVLLFVQRSFSFSSSLFHLSQPLIYSDSLIPPHFEFINSLHFDEFFSRILPTTYTTKRLFQCGHYDSSLLSSLFY